MNFESKIEKKEFDPDKIKITCDTQEAAIKIVQDFWHSMPHGQDISLPADDDIDGWCSELTMGDRTIITKDRKSGKWIISIFGNHQPLTKEAEEWRKKCGF